MPFLSVFLTMISRCIFYYGITDEQHVWSLRKGRALMRKGSRMVHRSRRNEAALGPGALCQRKVWRKITVLQKKERWDIDIPALEGLVNQK